jgi:2-oxoacid:acceptor oxidoreductase delta subunit (pyruvate/2-ketoisovalerate family)
MFCPEPAIIVKDGKFVSFDYDYCKGCGICAKECPEKAGAIEMVPEF